MSLSRFNLFWIVTFSCTLPAAVVLSTHLARQSFERVKLRGQTITVKGFAERRITSDFAIWTPSLDVRHENIAGGYQRLDDHRKKLLALLAQAGFPSDKVKQLGIDIQKIYKQDDKGNRRNDIEAFVLTQQFEITTDDVQRIATAAVEASVLIKDGIELDAGEPRYFYTKLDALKLQMIGEATLNARARATELVEKSQGTLGHIQSASQGVFQITPVYSTEVSGSGENDTSAIDKSIKAVVTVEYEIL